MSIEHVDILLIDTPEKVSIVSKHFNLVVSIFDDPQDRCCSILATKSAGRKLPRSHHKNNKYQIAFKYILNLLNAANTKICFFIFFINLKFFNGCFEFRNHLKKIRMIKLRWVIGRKIVKKFNCRTNKGVCKIRVVIEPRATGTSRKDISFTISNGVKYYTLIFPNYISSAQTSAIPEVLAD